MAQTNQASTESRWHDFNSGGHGCLSLPLFQPGLEHSEETTIKGGRVSGRQTQVSGEPCSAEPWKSSEQSTATKSAQLDDLVWTTTSRGSLRQDPSQSSACRASSSFRSAGEGAVAMSQRSSLGGGRRLTPNGIRAARLPLASLATSYWGRCDGDAGFLDFTWDRQY